MVRVTPVGTLKSYAVTMYGLWSFVHTVLATGELVAKVEADANDGRDNTRVMRRVSLVFMMRLS